ncbi:MAG: 2-C-methyl-D-erythritol 4-phosphate cytidylyltransferase [Spirochaetia bacterium]|jgi:2-C-methyl-D-erythritol 4-phosphate cytidylyltransferase|nr:2-C-methyl-D-erythritol 4-phosphate cytidylyltransferase [Spirochaetia bacterium]
MNSALIFAGGSGRRMNTKSKPKQFLQLYGKEILVYTIENFQKHPEIDNIIVVCKENWIPYFKELLVKYKLDKVKWIVPGGSTGQESIYKGLLELSKHVEKDTIVLVHDGVRPFVDAELISKCISCTQEHHSAITVVPAVETFIQLDGEKVDSITDRSKCCLAQAPQCFFLGELLATHEQARKEGHGEMIDSASLMKNYGYPLYVVFGNYDNIKITTPSDFYVFRALYDVRENQQIFGI